MRMSLSSSHPTALTPSIPRRPAPPLALSPPAPTGALAVPAFLLAALYAIPIVVTLRPIADPDIWWHLRVGQWVSEHHTVPVTDPFSAPGADKPWIAYSWLFEVLVYHLYALFGLAGILAYRVVLALAVTAALHHLIRRREPRFFVATLLTALAVLALAPSLTERPWLFTILFSILTLDVLLEARAGRSARGMWLLPLVFALWANLHIQFVYGLLLLGLACVTPSGSWDAAKDWNRRCRLCGLMGLCLLATLANPYHVQLYGVVMEYATQPGPFRCINELRALEFREPPDWVGLLLGAAATFALGRRRRVSSFEVLLLAGAAILAFRSRRDLWFLVAVAVALLAGGGRRPLKAREPAGDTLGAAILPRCWGVAAGLLALLIAFLAWQRDLSAETLQQTVAKTYPVEAAAIVAERGYAGPLFNDFNWGGFLIWSLPQLPVVLDGRTNLHGDERILRSCNTWAAGPGWRDDPDLAQAGVVVADAQTPLGCVLPLDERFELVHEDAVARVFIRKRTNAAKPYRAERGTP
jgi:hypothetical protein